MTDKEIFDLYVLQSKNVRRLKQVEDSLIKDINFYLKRNDDFQVEIKTRLLALLYCTLSEAQYIQILHTPNGFEFSEIQEIKKQKSIGDKWQLIIDLAMNRVGSWKEPKNAQEEDRKTRRNHLHEIVKEYIEKPHGLRNKIAHGQWVHALNSDNTAENKDLSTEINNLDVVTLTIWSKVHQYLAFIIRDLVQSPKIGHHNNYWIQLTELDTFLTNSSNWSTGKRKERLQKKKPKKEKPN